MQPNSKVRLNHVGDCDGSERGSFQRLFKNPSSHIPDVLARACFFTSSNTNAVPQFSITTYANSQHQIMPPKLIPPTPQEWETRKAQILGWYLDDNMSMSVITIHLKNAGFHTT